MDEDATIAAFRSSAGPLAVWAGNQLVNRDDVYGQYRSLTSRTSGSKNFMAPDPPRRVPGALTESLLRRHFAGYEVWHLLGVHAIGHGNLCRWIAIDIDQHDERHAGTTPNLSAAIGWYTRLREMGFRPLLLDSNGNVGFHLWAFFAQPIHSRRAFDFARWLTADYAARGLSRPPETFPKQAELTPSVRYGNWLRLPGRHHTRDFWTRAWCDDWLSGHAVVDYLLGMCGDDPQLIPTTLVTHVETTAAVRSNRPAAPAADILTLLDGVAEGGRHEALVRLTGHYREHGLPENEILKLIALWNARNTPPLESEYVNTHVRDIMTRYGLHRRRRNASPVSHYRL